MIGKYVKSCYINITSLLRIFYKLKIKSFTILRYENHSKKANEKNRMKKNNSWQLTSY